MAVKIHIGIAGNQYIAETKQVENKETGEVVAYFAENPLSINYVQNDNGTVGLNFSAFCLASDDTTVTINKDAILALVDPTTALYDAYLERLSKLNSTDETSTPDTEDGSESDSTD